MSFLDLLKHRRSIRQYKEEAVSKEALEAIVEQVCFLHPDEISVHGN